jgi:hypothetical protein
MEATTRVVVAVMPVKSPIHGETRGRRIAAAYPNRSGLKGAVSFRKPYLVMDAAVTSEGDVERFMARLTEQGFYR